ncbi:MAG TPA: glycosyltransferase family 1 protein [Candidatus Acidoferrales bacterium]|jgi:glycosyltransferase involved in cell wall biosynthesis|nr:glycosyltransferase family 1 protein [Candidatus Acidoferrales bacterium]
MALHIVIDARRIRDFGIGTYIRSLILALSKIDSTNQYTVVSGPADANMLSELPENFRSALYARDDHSFFDHLAFPVFLRGLSPDLVHIPLNRIPLLMIKPYVVTVHDMANLLFEDHSSIRMQLRRFRFRRGLMRANRVIAVSEATKRDVEKVLGVPPDRIRRVYNAPDPGFSQRASSPGQEQSRILERYQITYPFLLYAGNIRKHKNVPRLVEAFAVVHDQLASHPVYKDLRLVIIGDTISDYPAVRQAVIKSGVEQVVRFLGFVPFDTLRCFYESAAAFVFPSRYEGFGLPPLEAMACGTPVVTSNVSSLPEVVGEAAVLVNPHNVFDIARGIREVLLNEELRSRLIRRGREQAARFSWSWTARQVLEIYRDAAGSR